MNNPNFGDRVSADTVLIRREKEKRDKDHILMTMRVWEEWPREIDGIFLGTRMLQNGQRKCDEDYGYYLEVHERLKAALVCPGPNRNPVYVPLNSLQAASAKPFR